MSPFLGSHENRLDAKGRVSVPAPFRALLKGVDATASLVLLPSPVLDCIECWPAPAFAALGAKLESPDVFSEENSQKAVALFGDAFPTEPDKEGRVMLPDDMVAHAKLAGMAMFIGAGTYFQIWEPVAGRAYKAAARAKALSQGGVRSAAGGAG